MAHLFALVLAEGDGSVEDDTVGVRVRINDKVADALKLIHCTHGRVFGKEKREEEMLNCKRKLDICGPRQPDFAYQQCHCR